MSIIIGADIVPTKSNFDFALIINAQMKLNTIWDDRLKKCRNLI